MTRLIQMAGYSAALFCLSLPAVAPAQAQAPARKYGFCYGAAGNPRLENFTSVFAVSPSTDLGAVAAGFVNFLSQKYNGRYTQENDCPVRATLAEAESFRRQLIDDMNHASPGSTIQIDWLPAGATALSGPAEKATASPAPPKPQAPVAAGAPAGSTAVQLDMWGKPIPTTAYWTCVTHMTKTAYAAKPFFGGANGKASNEIFAAFNDYLIKTYHEAGTASCNQFTTLAEAQKSLAQQEAAAPSTGYKWVGIDWTYSSNAPSPPAAAPASAPKPPSPAPVVAATVKPPSPAPAKPAPAATSKPSVYVFCRSEFNTSMKRFYNPPVDGRGATYAEWQPSYQKYLEKNYGPQTNISCSNYAAKDVAQKDYEEAVANARAQPTMNGLQSPIVITNWAY